MEVLCLLSYASAKKIGRIRDHLHLRAVQWLRGWDSNPRPSGYEPDELPDCSTPRQTWVDRPRTPRRRRGRKLLVERGGFEPPKARASRFTVCPVWPLRYLSKIAGSNWSWRADSNR